MIELSTAGVYVDTGELCPMQRRSLTFHKDRTRFSFIYYPKWAINIILLMVVDIDKKL